MRWSTLLVLAAMAPGVSAQSVTHTLDSSGTWAVTRTPEPGSDEEFMLRARRLLAEGKASAAEDLLDGWIEKNGRGESPYRADAYLLRGDARTAQGDEEDAVRDYEVVVGEYPESDQFVVALEREMAIAIRYLNGLRRKFLGLRIDSGEVLGQEILVRVNQRLEGSRLAERALIELADFYYRTRDMISASTAYEIFLVLYPRSEYRAKAMQRRVSANIARFNGPKYDATGLVDAGVLIRDYIASDPDDAQAAGIDTELLARLEAARAAQMLDRAEWYLRREDRVSARFMLRRVVRRFPETPAGERAIELLAENGWGVADAAPSSAGADPAKDAGP